MTNEEKNERETLLGKFFTPGRSIDTHELLAGRTEQLRSVIDAIKILGQHIMIYGERGVGKTSLATVIPQRLQVMMDPNLPALRVNCDQGDTFVSVWRKVFNNIAATYAGTGFGQTMKVAGPPLSTNLSDNSGPSDIANLLRKIPNAVIILDEFDRLSSKKISALFADCIKALSDYAIPVTIIIVGVADDISGLITEHQSIVRCITQIFMQRMSNDELEQIIATRYPKTKMSFDKNVAKMIARLSQGFPHYTHLLGLNAGRAALDRNSVNVTWDDVKLAIDRSLKDVSATIQQEYHDGTTSSRKGTLYEAVLLACALAESNERGYFSAAGVRGPMSKIMNREYDIPAYAQHLSDFCSPDRGNILERKGKKRRYIYRFSNPLMRPYVYLRGIATNKVPNDFSPLLVPEFKDGELDFSNKPEGN